MRVSAVDGTLRVNDDVMDLPYAHGGPPLSGRLRVSAEDFFVDEDLGFVPDGSGEHVFLRIEKRDANTEWVARELARFVAVAPDAVSYAGLKDRHAVTRQTFSLPLPIKREVDWSGLSHPEFRLLEVVRHGRKLKRGALKGNRFRIVLREVSGDRETAEQVLVAIRRDGVPNFFGEQRFGREGGNVRRARAMFAGQRVQRHERSLLLSAARSQIFNQVLAQRVSQGNWNQGMAGEVWMLDGRHSIFGPETMTTELDARLRGGDIHPTGPLCGRGELRSSLAVAAIEQAVMTDCDDLARGLVTAGLEQERRSLRLFAQSLEWDWQDASLHLAFALPAGAYATSILRELARYGAETPGVAVQE